VPHTRSGLLARFVATVPDDEIPGPVRAKARRHILDTLACGLAGACSSEAQRLSAMIRATEPAGGSPVWGAGQSVSPRAAALVNGTAAHAFELDDTGGCDHSGAVVLPAAIAALDLAGEPVSGAAFTSAIIFGYDVARRVLEACGAYAPHNEAGWHSTATCGTFGAAAAASRILRLDEIQTTNAFGHAASFSGGLWAFIHDGAQTKRIHAGRAAEGGLLAALMAQAGLTGPHSVFEAVWGGFLRTFAPLTADPEALTRGLGEAWRLERVAIKPYASCRGTHAAIDALGAAMAANDLKAGDIAAITVHGPAFLASMCGGRDVSSLAAAQMSLPFALAARAVYGAVGLDAFRAEARMAPAIAAMMARVDLCVDPALASTEEPFLAIATVDGRRIENRVTVPLGAPANPIGDAAHAGKIRQLAGRVLDAAAIDRLVAAIEGLEEAPDIRALPALLAGSAAPTLFV
jgi:2-methylcitrate dehydratase PrpD